MFPSQAVNKLRLGEILTHAGRLKVTDVARVLDMQTQVPTLFGEAAIELSMVTAQDVAWALAEQSFAQTGEGYTVSLTGNTWPVVCKPTSQLAVAFHTMRVRLMLQFKSISLKAFAVVSHDHRVGRSYIAANLAAAYALTGYRTLLIDANGDAPALSQPFLSLPPPGAVARVRDLPMLSFISMPRRAGKIETYALGEILRGAEADYAMAIVDTSAAQQDPSAELIAAEVGAALLIARRHRSSIQTLSTLHSRLDAAHINILGCVINHH